MASSSFRYCHFGLHCDLKVTFFNDSVSRSKRPLKDLPEGDEPLQSASKRQFYEAVSLTSNGYRDDSDLDATMLELSDGEQPDSPGRLSPESEARMLEDDPADVLVVSPWLAFGLNGKEADSSQLPASPNFSDLSSIPATSISKEPLPPTGPSDHLSRSLACRKDPVTPACECGSNLNTGFLNPTAFGWSLKSAVFPEAVPCATASVSLETGGDTFGETDEEATQVVPDASCANVNRPAASESSSVVAEGPSEGQAVVDQNEVEGESESNPLDETEGATNSVGLQTPQAASRLNSASDQSEARGGNPGTGEPNSPARTRHQIKIQEADLELSKDNYVNAVLAHVHHHVISEVNELRALMERVASEYRSQEPVFRHPTDLTVRNYVQRVSRPGQRYSLKQWVDKNERHHKRFEHIPDRFNRSPIPNR